VMVAVEMGNKAWVEIATGDLDAAEQLTRESLSRTDAADDYGVAFCLLTLGRIALEREDASGAEMLGAAEAILSRAGLAWDPADAPEYERTLSLARSVAGDTFDERIAHGRTRLATSF